MPSYAPAKVVTKLPRRKSSPRPFDPAYLARQKSALNYCNALLDAARACKDDFATEEFACAVAHATLLEHVRVNREYTRVFAQMSRHIQTGMRLLEPRAPI